MPIKYLMLIVGCVICAAGVTIWIASAVISSSIAALPIIGLGALAAFLGWRVLAARLR